MGWRFRKSFNPLPGIRLNFSPRGISTSVGAGPARLYLGSQGAAVTTAYHQTILLLVGSMVKSLQGSSSSWRTLYLAYQHQDR